MQKKNLEKQLKKEAIKFAPNKLQDIYSSLGISFLNCSSNKDIEKALSEEGNKVINNNINTINEKLGINTRTNNESYIKNRMGEEKDSFVPVVIDDVYNSINHKNPKNKFYLFMHDKANITIFSSFLLVCILSSIIIPIVLNKNNNLDDSAATDNDENSTIITTDTSIKPTNENGVTIDVASPSETYRAKATFFVGVDGTIDANKIITKDDQSAYVIDNIDKNNQTTAQSKYAIGNDETIFSFTNKYLISALNCGILEKQNITNFNSIKFYIETRNDNGNYFNAIKSEINDEIIGFMKNYKVVANIQILKSEEDDVLSTLNNHDLADYISEVYNIASRIFAFSNGTYLEDAYFSNDLKDWIEVFKDYSVEQMKDITTFVWFINDNISTQNEIDKTLNEFVDGTASIKEDVKKLNSYLTKIVSFREEIFGSLKNDGNDLRNTYSTYSKLIEALIKNYGEQSTKYPKNFYMYTPNDEQKEWKWWENGLHHYKPEDKLLSIKKETEDNSLVPPNEFIDSLTKYDDLSNLDKSEQTLLATLYDQYQLEHYLQGSINKIDDCFNKIFTKIKNGDYGHGERKDDDYNHYKDEPPDWDESFDDWWNHHYNH